MVVSNRSISMDVEISCSPLIRRSGDNLILTCTKEDGRISNASVPSTMGVKIIASAVFIDFGIPDATADKHREYPAGFAILIKKK